MSWALSQDMNLTLWQEHWHGVNLLLLEAKKQKVTTQVIKGKCPVDLMSDKGSNKWLRCECLDVCMR